MAGGMKLIDTRFLPLLLLVACARASSPQLASTDPTDEVAVQSAVLDEFRTGAMRLVVLDSTVAGASHYVDEDYASALAEFGPLAPGLREDFDRKRHQRAAVLQPRSRVSIVLVGKRTLDSLRHDSDGPRGYWDRFHRRFPGAFGRVSLSRVGFSADGNHALVLADYGCGGRCGGTRYYLLQRTAEGWRVVRMSQPRIV